MLQHVKQSFWWTWLRWFKHFADPKRHRPRSTPIVNFEVTNHCTARCIFCPYSIMERKKEPMDMTSFKKSVDDLATAGGTNLTFCVTMGDPLLDPYLFERAEYVRQKINPKELGFVTTLQVLHKWDLDKFLTLFNWLLISLSLSGRESYKKFFGVDLYPAMIRNLENLLVKNKALGKPMNFVFSFKPIDMPIEEAVNHPDVERIGKIADIDFKQAVRASFESKQMFEWSDSFNLLPDYLKDRVHTLFPRAFTPCESMYSTLMVYSNGKVAPCNCRDYEANSDLILGNSKEESIINIWNGEKLKQMRDDWRTKNIIPNLCKSCRNYRY